MTYSNTIFKVITLLVLSLFLIEVAQADRVARVLYYGALADAPEVAFVYQNGEVAQEVVLDRHNFSKSFNLSNGPLKLTFLAAPKVKGVPLPEEAPYLDIPKEWKKVLILVFPDTANVMMPIRLKAINANDDVFGPGELYFVNFSDLTIFGLVGEQKMRLNPESSETVKNPIKERGDYQVKLDTVQDTIKSRRWLLRQTWRHQPDVRRVIFALPLPAPRTLKLYSAPIRNF